MKAVIKPSEYNSKVMSVFLNSPIGTLIVGLDGSLIRTNKSFQEFIGYSDKELESLDFQRITYPDDLNIDLANCESLIGGKEDSYQIEKRYVHKNGHTIWGELSVVIVKDDDQKPWYFVSQVRDITARKSKLTKIEAKLDQLEQVVESNLEGFWEWHIQDDYEYMSPSFWYLLGYDPATKKHHPSEWQKLIHPEDFLKAKKNFDQHVKSLGKEPYNLEVRYLHKKGHYIWVICKGKVVEWDQEGKPLRMIGSHIDITLTKNQQQVISNSYQELSQTYQKFKDSQASLGIKELELESLASRLKLALSASKIGVWDLDLKTFNIICDERILEINGFEKGANERYIKEWLKIILPEDLKKIETLYQECLQEKKEFDLTFRIKKATGEIAYIRSVAQIIFKGSHAVRMVGIHQDITSDKKKEEEILMARVAAENASKAKALFLANMSHEIRTPINGVIGMGNLLAGTKLNSEQKDYLKGLMESSTNLLSLINDILDFSKFEQGKIEFDTIDFGFKDLVKEVGKFFELELKKKKINIEYEFLGDAINEISKGDSSRIKQVLLNLVGNAIKFSEVESSIKLGLEVQRNVREHSCRFYVIDKGIGISLETQDKLFHKFVQAEASTSRKYGGSGLGLSICKEIIKGLGGKIGVISKEGSGAKFWFTLTLPKGKKGHVKSNIITFKEAKKLGVKASILVVEDNVINQKVASTLLSKLGLGVQVVANGIEAIDITDKVHFDLVFMDCQMPEMDGFEATKVLRKKGFTQPIVAMTANAFDEDKKRCLSIGMNDFLAKPFHQEDIKKILLKWLSQGSVLKLDKAH